MKFHKILASFCVPFFIAACSNYGAVQLPPDRISYNGSLQYSDNQQMLLNIVRLRYTDIPYFLSVNNVVSQFNITRSLALDLANNTAPPPALTASADGSVSLSESPTITYTPLQGADYVTKLLTPIDLSVVYMLMRTGWGINQVFRMFIQHLGRYDNATLASRTTSSRVPNYKNFQKFGLLMRRLQYGDNIVVVGDKIDNRFAIRLTIKNFKSLDPTDRAMLAKHGVTPKTPSAWIVSYPSTDKRHIYAQTRTVLGLFNYLSKGVDVPPEDVAKKLVPMTYLPNGQVFDWHQITVGQMRIHSSKYRPKNGYLAVRYRDYWFYIADDDFDSKETMNILSIIMGIYQGEIKSFLPVFTVS